MSSGKAKQLAASKKYYPSSEHELGKGRFVILDRYLDEEGYIMLKFEWISGLKVGTIETNKEQNINSALYKYGLTAKKLTWSQASISPMADTMEDIQRLLTESNATNVRLEDKLDAITEVMVAQGEMIARLVTALTK